jgi:hypothetical protein
MVCCEIQVISSIWNKKEFFNTGGSGSVILPIYAKSDKTRLVIIDAYLCYQPHIKSNPVVFCQV